MSSTDGQHPFAIESSISNYFPLELGLGVADSDGPVEEEAGELSLAPLDFGASFDSAALASPEGSEADSELLEA